MVWLVVGLGNPGPEYAATRHNVGQMVVDAIAQGNKARWTTHKSRTDVAAYKIGTPPHAESVIIAKSKSYMNESGGPIKALAAFYKVDPSHIIVLHDELDIAFSTIRVKLAGGDNGHNGLKSLTSSLGTSNYYRVRMGVGRPIGQQDPADFVLKQFSVAEKKELSDFFLRGAEAVESLITKGLEVTQQDFNS
ncbi:MAG: aminoacyl-tRNA hydrolase [Candidatus Nanopelagicaceae bacterium]|nr:aminoacyl-tRNA hydrolase [Candidatus Nanopelagicaceae bacterium]